MIALTTFQRLLVVAWFPVFIERVGVGVQGGVQGEIRPGSVESLCCIVVSWRVVVRYGRDPLAGSGGSDDLQWGAGCFHW